MSQSIAFQPLSDGSLLVRGKPVLSLVEQKLLKEYWGEITWARQGYWRWVPTDKYTREDYRYTLHRAQCPGQGAFEALLIEYRSLPAVKIMKKTLVIDKDGTLVKSISGETFPKDPEDQQLLSPLILPRLAQYRRAGYEIAIATNQGGVAAGHKSLEDAISETIFAMQLAGIEYAMLAPSYETHGHGEAVWIDLSDGGSFVKVITLTNERFRKPAPGMIRWLPRRIHGDEHGEVLFVGDMDIDLQAGVAGGARFMYPNQWLSASLIAASPDV